MFRHFKLDQNIYEYLGLGLDRTAFNDQKIPNSPSILDCIISIPQQICLLPIVPRFRQRYEHSRN